MISLADGGDLSQLVRYVFGEHAAVVLVVSLVLNAVLGIAFFFKSTLNEIAHDCYTRFQARRDQRRALLIQLHEHMHQFEGLYLVAEASMLLRDVGEPDITAMADQLHGVCNPPFQAALEFLGKQELNMPRAVRSRIDDLRKAMRPATPGALMDPADIRRRTEGVKQAVEEIQREIRDSIK